MEISGLLSYFVFFLTFAGIYAVMALALNIHWGFTGMLNVGIAGFFAVGAYSSALITSTADPSHAAGYGLPLFFGFVVAAIASGILAFFIGLITLRLRSDYLAIASIGIAEIVRLFLKNEDWLTGGVRGYGGIPSRLSNVIPDGSDLAYMIFTFLMVALVYFLIERAYRSPWGRVLRAIRENEAAARAMGKNALSFRLQSFVLGSAIMGVGGALYAHFVGYLSPEAFDPLFATFIIWVMLIAGGSGNNVGAIVGAAVIWAVWSMTEIVTSNFLPAELQTQGAAIRVFLIGFLLQVILLTKPRGLFPEKPPKPIR